VPDSSAEASSSSRRGQLCLVVIFNHNFERNLPILDRIYKGRFDHVRYLMPFYSGNRADVIPVYATSYLFQSYIVQAYHQLDAEGFDSYIFTGDDVLLNPRLNQDNILDELQARDRSYITELRPLWTMPWFWWHTIPALRAFKRERYVEFHQHLPSPEAFDEAMKRHGIVQKKMGRSKLVSHLFWDLFNERKPVFLDNFIYWAWHAGGRTHEYPLVHSYSDFIIIPRRTFKPFCHLIGIFAAMNLFVEMAIPTALLLVEDKITVEKDTQWFGNIALGVPARDALVAKHDFKLEAIEQSMGEREIFLHPFKLSQLKQ
jgi:hypothetical protein